MADESRALSDPIPVTSSHYKSACLDSACSVFTSVFTWRGIGSVGYFFYLEDLR